MIAAEMLLVTEITSPDNAAVDRAAALTRLAVEPSDLRWRFIIPMRGLEELPVLLT